MNEYTLDDALGLAQQLQDDATDAYDPDCAATAAEREAALYDELHAEKEPTSRAEWAAIVERERQRNGGC